MMKRLLQNRIKVINPDLPFSSWLWCRLVFAPLSADPSSPLQTQSRNSCWPAQSYLWRHQLSAGICPCSCSLWARMVSGSMHSQRRVTQSTLLFSMADSRKNYKGIFVLNSIEENGWIGSEGAMSHFLRTQINLFFLLFL